MRAKTGWEGKNNPNIFNFDTFKIGKVSKFKEKL